MVNSLSLFCMPRNKHFPPPDMRLKLKAAWMKLDKDSSGLRALKKAISCLLLSFVFNELRY